MKKNYISMRYFSEMRNSKLYEGIPYLGVNIRTYIKVFPGDILFFLEKEKLNITAMVYKSGHQVLVNMSSKLFKTIYVWLFPSKIRNFNSKYKFF